MDALMVSEPGLSEPCLSEPGLSSDIAGARRAMKLGRLLMDALMACLLESAEAHATPSERPDGVK